MKECHARKRVDKQLKSAAISSSAPKESASGTSAILYVKFNFRTPKRSRKDSVVSVDLESDSEQPAIADAAKTVKASKNAGDNNPEQ